MKNSQIELSLSGLIKNPKNINNGAAFRATKAHQYGPVALSMKSKEVHFISGAASSGMMNSFKINIKLTVKIETKYQKTPLFAFLLLV